MNYPRVSFRLLWWLLPFLAMGGSITARSDQGPVAGPDDGWVQLAAQIDRNVHAGTRLLAAAREQLEDSDQEAQAEFSHIEKTVRAAEARLRRSLKSVETASPDNWARARAALAAHYESYSQAVAQVERLLSLVPSGGRRAPPPR